MAISIKDIHGVQAKNIRLPDLYHISFKDNLEGIWVPRLPDGTFKGGAPEEEVSYPEPLINRISATPTIKGCFIGIFLNVKHFFKRENIPYMNFYVYSPKFKGDERIVTPSVLSSDRLIWDAVITDEYFILDKVEMVLVGEVKIYNTNKEKFREIHPFGDKTLPVKMVGPENIRFEWLNGPNPVEAYTEGPDSTFTHMGKNYSVDQLLSLTRNLSVTEFSLNKLKWMVEDDYDIKRMRAADTKVPVLVYKLENGSWVTMDGYHRVVKAIKLDKLKTIPAKIVTEQIFKQLLPL